MAAPVRRAPRLCVASDDKSQDEVGRRALAGSASLHCSTLAPRCAPRAGALRAREREQCQVNRARQAVQPLQTAPLQAAPASSANDGIPSFLRHNVDQTPLELSSKAYSWAEKGANSVHVADKHGQHKQERLATLQLCFNVSGVPELQPKLVIVFRGKGFVPQTEIDAYDKRVVVFFQAKVSARGGCFVLFQKNL